MIQSLRLTITIEKETDMPFDAEGLNEVGRDKWGLRPGGRPPERNKKLDELDALFRAGKASLRMEGGVTWYEYNGKKIMLR